MAKETTDLENNDCITSRVRKSEGPMIFLVALREVKETGFLKLDPFYILMMV